MYTVIYAVTNGSRNIKNSGVHAQAQFGVAPAQTVDFNCIGQKARGNAAGRDKEKRKGCEEENRA